MFLGLFPGDIRPSLQVRVHASGSRDKDIDGWRKSPREHNHC